MGKESTKMTERFELVMYPDMRKGLDVVARRRGLTASTLIKYLIAMELTATLGQAWVDPTLDHPYGDLQGQDPGKALSEKLSERLAEQG